MKIGQYLVKIWTKYDGLLFWATLYFSQVHRCKFLLHVSCTSFLSVTCHRY